MLGYWHPKGGWWQLVCFCKGNSHITLQCIFCEHLMWSSGNDVISGMFASEAKGAQRLLLFVVTKHQ